MGEIIFKFFCLKFLKKIDIVKVFDNIIMVLLEEFLFSDVIIIEWLIKVIWVVMLYNCKCRKFFVKVVGELFCKIFVEELCIILLFLLWDIV